MIITTTRIGHLSRYFKQKVVLPKAAIIGGYHGGNLGDMALGLAVSQVLNKEGISNGLQTIYNLNKWPKAPFAIVGGGAVGYNNSLLNLYDRYKGNFFKLGFLGVDFNETNYPDRILKMIREAAFVSCRSLAQAEKLKKITDREVIYHHPDIAFSLLPDLCLNARTSTKSKKVFVNVLPLYGSYKDRIVMPNFNYQKERPELYKNFSLMHKNYLFAVRESVKQALNNGYEVESIPFTPEDREYSKFILSGLPVKFPPYHSDPVKMLKHISTGEKIISTRFHATIFGLKTGAVMQSIAYATKNELMLRELGLLSSEYLSTTNLAEGQNNLPIGTKANPEIISKWEKESTTMIENCVKSVFFNK